MKNGVYFKADSLFSRANIIEPNNLEIVNSLALTSYYLNRIQNAYKLFEKAIEIDKTFPTTYTNYAFCLNGEKKFQKAIKYLNKGLEYANNDKTKAIFHYTFAISYFGVNECNLSKKNIDLAIKLETDKVLLKDYKEYKSHLQERCN